VRRRLFIFAAAVSILLFAGAGCIYIPIRELSPPAFNTSNNGLVRSGPFDVRTACCPDGPVRVGMSRDQVRELVGQPAESLARNAAASGSEERFRFTGMTDYFYIFGESPIGTHTYLTSYTLSIEYDGSGRVTRCQVRRDSGIGLLGL
jgi:hypothetical protein